MVIEMGYLHGLALGFAYCFLCVGCSLAEPPQRPEYEGIKAPIYDYVEGWYDKDVTRMEHGLHQDLAKRHMNPEATDGLDKLDLPQLVELVPLYGGVNGDERKIDIEVLDVDGDIASAKVVSNDYVDYMQLGRVGDRWQIINVLWRFVSDNTPDGPWVRDDLIKKPVYDYVEGWYDKDAARMRAGLHPALAKRNLNPEAPSGVDQMDLPQLVELLPQYGGQGSDQRRIDITLLDVAHDMASAKVISNAYVDYLQLGYWNDQWWVVNVLWKFSDGTESQAAPSPRTRARRF